MEEASIKCSEMGGIVDHRHPAGPRASENKPNLSSILGARAHG